MTFYEREINRIKGIVYSNQAQVDKVVEIRNYIRTHYASNLNLVLLSRLRLTSKFHLLRLYKKYYGQTPKQYQTEKRMEQSKECLRQGMSITETCFAVGFESPCSFSTLFKERTGMKPTEFQKKAIFTRSISREFSSFVTHSKIPKK